MRSSTTSTRHRSVAATIVVGMLGALTVACVPNAPTGPTPIERFCETWERIEDAPPTAERPVLVAEEVVAKAETTDMVGADCTAPGAAVELDDAVLAPGEEIDESAGDPETDRVALVTGPELGAQTAADALTFDNLAVTSLGASIGPSGIRVDGTLAVTLSGRTSAMSFTGTLADLNNWSIGLSSGALSIPGITTSPARFAGTLRSSHGVQSLSLSASVPEVVIGDVRVTGAELSIEASEATGVSATVSGSVTVGPTTATGTVDVDFDDRGNLVKIDAELAARLVGFQASGTTIDLQGVVTVKGNLEQTAATFSASGRIGELVVSRASGELRLANNRVTLVGAVDAEISGVTTRLDATIIWDGQIAAADLSAEVAGKYSGFLDDGTLVSVDGELTAETGIGGIVTTTVTGDFRVGNLYATGSATVHVQGLTTTLDVTADVGGALGPVAGDATITGVIEIVDGDVSQLDLRVSANSISFGEVSLHQAQLSLLSQGVDDPIDIRVATRVVVEPYAVVDAQLDATLGPDGGFLSLVGTASGDVAVSGVTVERIDAQLYATPYEATLKVSAGTVQVAGIVLNDIEGVLTAEPENDAWNLTTTKAVSLFGGIISVPAGALRIRPADGEFPTGIFAVGIKAQAVVLGVTYSAGAILQLAPTGECALWVSARGFWVQMILLDVLAMVLPCQVDGPRHVF